MSELWGTLWRLLRDPRLSAALVLGLWVVGGLGAIVAAYVGTSDQGLVALQLPYVISGAIAGIAVVGIGLGLLSIHLDRAESAEERRQLAQVRAEVMRLVKAAGPR